MNAKLVAPALCVLLLACEDKPSSTGAAASAPLAVSAAPAASSAPAASAAPTASASAAPAASASAAPAGDAKDAVVTVKDPVAEPQKTVKATIGGTVTLYLPDYPGTVWSADSYDKTIGKPKEEVIPGFAPGTNGHQFQWNTKNPLLKAGGSHKVTFVNKKAGKANEGSKPSGTFTLTIELQ